MGFGDELVGSSRDHQMLVMILLKEHNTKERSLQTEAGIKFKTKMLCHSAQSFGITTLSEFGREDRNPLRRTVFIRLPVAGTIGARFPQRKAFLSSLPLL